MSYLTFNTGSPPSTPVAGKASLYVASTDKCPQFITEQGVIGPMCRNWLTNWIRNSGFWFAQRQTTSSTATYSATSGRAISADGWGITNENASVTYQRIDTSGSTEAGLQGRFYGQFLKITNTGKLIISQVIEGTNTCAIRGRTVRLQCWLKSQSGTPTVNLALVQLTNAGTLDTIPATFIAAFGANGTDPTLGTNLSYITPKTGVTPDGATVVGNHASCVLSTTWQRFGCVFDVPSNCKNLVVLVYGDSQFAAAAGINISQVSLVDGYEIQAWSPQTIEEELQKVQRFYSKSFNVDTAPAQSVATGALRGHVSVAGATAGQPIGLRFPVPMRAAPGTLTFYNPAAANAFVRNTTAGTDATATASANIGENGGDITFTGIAAWTVAQAVQIQFSADAEL